MLLSDDVVVVEQVSYVRMKLTRVLTQNFLDFSPHRPIQSVKSRLLLLLAVVAVMCIM